MFPPGRLLAVVAVLAMAAACSKTPPRVTPPPPPPPPPPAVLAARSLAAVVDLAVPVPPLAVSELVEPPEPSEPKPRPPAPAPPPPEPPEPPERPPVRVGTPETADAAATTKQVNATLARAREALAKVRPEVLSADARVQYQTARRLIEQAGAAVEANNFLYAIRLADKAETLARRLAGGLRP